MVPTPSEIILAVLEEARRQSRTPLLKTVLIKLLYLLDLFIRSIRTLKTEFSEGPLRFAWECIFKQ
jgi:hypothetical protein